MPWIASGPHRVFHHAEGEGPSVVLVHGSASGSMQWRRLQADLASRYHSLALDLLGYGKTEGWSPAGGLALADEVAALVAAAAILPPPYHLVAHSYGGVVALDAALSAALPLTSLTLIEPVVFGMLEAVGEAAAWAEIRGVAVPFMAAVSRGTDDADAIRPFVDYWNGPGAFDRLPDPLRAAIAATAPKIACEWPLALAARPAVDRLDVPTLLIRGGATRLPAARIIDLIAARMPQASVVTIAGAGHLAPVTHAAAANAVIRDHLDRRPR